MPAQFVDGFLAELALHILPVEIWFVWRPQLSDANDEMVLEAAINGRAEAIVTHNIRDFSTVSKRFAIEVWSPAETLEKIREKGKQL